MKYSKHLAMIASCCVVGLALPANAVILNEEAFDSANIQPGGPQSGIFGELFFNVDGSGNPMFSTYAIADFNFGTQTTPIASINSISLNLTQDNAPFTVDGDIVFLLDTSPTLASTDPTTSPLAFSPPDPGTNQDELDGDLSLINIGNGSFVQVISGTVDTFNLSLNPAAETEIVDRLNAEETIRIIVGSGDAGVTATYAGFSNQNFAGPTLEIDAAPVPFEAETSTALVIGGLFLGFRLRKRMRNRH